MRGPVSDNDRDSYETRLAREDRKALRFGLIVVVVLTLVMSSFLDVWRAFWVLIPLMVFNTIVHAWNAYRMIRTGYVVRGRAMIPGVWWTAAVTLLLGVTLWVQGHFGLWFAQYLV